MTHFAVLVITPDRPDDEAMWSTVLWPWCYSNLDTREPRFDYCKIGGRFEGILDPEWTHEGCKPVRDSSQRCRKDLDIAALQTRAGEREALLYDRIHTALAGCQIPDIARLIHDYGEGWRERFDADPAVLAVRSVAPFLWTETIIRFSDPRDTVLARARRYTLVTNAVVSDGTWYNSDLFNMDEDPVRAEAWADRLNRLVAKAGPDDWLTIVDCHR